MSKPAKKPIVFLSHSSRDKQQLTALKKLLDERAAGSINFFLSSDGQSIPLGQNWLVRISDALKRASLMFVFVSPESVDSKWIQFEAGHAFASKIPVVPVCLPGMNLERVGPPLNILQGFNLHSHESMANLARKCNEVCELKMKETFKADEFKKVFSGGKSQEDKFLGKYSWAIKEVRITASIELSEPFEAIPTLAKIAKSSKVEVFQRRIIPSSGNKRTAEVDFAGCSLWVSEPRMSEETGKPPATFYMVYATLSPQLLESNATILENWFKDMGFDSPYSVMIHFKRGIRQESEVHMLTTKLHKSPIRFLGENMFRYDGFGFQLGSNISVLEFQCKGKLVEKPLGKVISTLFELDVMWQSQEQPSVFDLPIRF